MPHLMDKETSSTQATAPASGTQAWGTQGPLAQDAMGNVRRANGGEKSSRPFTGRLC